MSILPIPRFLLNPTYPVSSISSFSRHLNKKIIMQTLREIYDVTSDTLTIKIPPNLSYPAIIKIDCCL
ncbi:MAG: hypothetical protein VSS75_021885 [Candidatus Parabeggiatoa sp.]|nr:hypothetical protein [Candidatus Parabeggiatoa sp.]